MRFGIASIVAIFALPAAWGQACTNNTTNGTYGFVCTGFMSPVPNAPQMPFTALGTVAGDRNGVFVGSATASLGGTIVRWEVVGTGMLNSDCTGNIIYDQKINGQAAGSIHITYQVLDQGMEIRGMPYDPGDNVSCDLRLMSRPWSANLDAATYRGQASVPGGPSGATASPLRTGRGVKKVKPGVAIRLAYHNQPPS